MNGVLIMHTALWLKDVLDQSDTVNEIAYFLPIYEHFSMKFVLGGLGDVTGTFLLIVFRLKKIGSA